jgi:hypothetical protein
MELNEKCCHSLVLESGMKLQDSFKPSDGSVKIANVQVKMTKIHSLGSFSENGGQTTPGHSNPR